MTENNFIGKIISYDPFKKEIVVKLHFLNVDRMIFLEEVSVDEKDIKIIISKRYKKLKTYHQLKRYYAMLISILLAQKIRPTPKRVKGLDTFVKEHLIECDFMEFEKFEESGRSTTVRVPLPPSKADMDVEEMNTLMTRIEEHFSYLNINWETGEKII